MLSLLKQINECKDLSNFDSRGLETEQKTEIESKNEGKPAGKGEKRDQEAHTQYSFCHPSPSHVKLVHTTVPRCALQLTSPPGFSITWCLRRSLAEKGQPLPGSGGAGCRLLCWARPPLLNWRRVLASCPWVHWYLIKLYPGQRKLNIRRLRGSWEEKGVITWADRVHLLRARRKGSHRTRFLFTLRRASECTLNVLLKSRRNGN